MIVKIIFAVLLMILNPWPANATTQGRHGSKRRDRWTGRPEISHRGIAAEKLGNHSRHWKTV